MNPVTTSLVAGRIADLYRNDDCARALFDWFHNRTNSARETKARVASDRTGFEYGYIVELLKKLDDIGVGKYVVGRKGAETRIIWEFDVKSLAKIALGESQELQSVPTDAPQDDDDPEDEIKHDFALRPDKTVMFRLPVNLTQREADRLASWIRSLPFE